MTVVTLPIHGYGGGAQLARYLSSTYPASIKHISVDADGVTIEGAARGVDGKVYLAEYPIWADTSGSSPPLWHSPEPLTDDFVLEVPRLAGERAGARDRLLSRWALVTRTNESVQLVSTARYANEVLAQRTAPHPVMRSKKGLGGFDNRRGHVEDLDELGIATITVNIPLGFLNTEPGVGRVASDVNGITYYVDKNAIDRLDATLLAAAQRDILVFAILLVNVPHNESAKHRAMIHPDYDPAGVFAMPDVTSAKGVQTYAAAIDLLAKRYSRLDARYGRIHHWIVHNEVDAGWTWTNAGKKTALEYMDLYHKSMRIVHAITRQYDAEAQSFISLTHAWSRPESPENYAPRELLHLLVRFCDSGGDFDWGIAYHPYPQSLLEPETWNDTQAALSIDTPFITFKNIEVLAAWARLPESKFEGKHRRRIFLTEQGFNSCDYTKDQLKLQAAAMAYAWKKIVDLPEVDGLHYHNWIDNRAEFGLRIGLRRFPDDADDPGGAKPIWHVYRALGESDEEDACRFALPIIGVDTWDEVAGRGPMDDLVTTQRGSE